MRKKFLLLVAVLTLLNASSSFAIVSDPLADLGEVFNTVKSECEYELANYCSNIVFKTGNLVNCLNKFEDKLSPQCKIAFNEGKKRFQEILPKVLHSVDACREDIEKTCSDSKYWSGQVVDCLKLNQDKINEQCKSALQEYGWMK